MKTAAIKPHTIEVDVNDPTSYKNYDVSDVIARTMTDDRDLEHITSRFPSFTKQLESLKPGDRILEICGGQKKVLNDIIKQYGVKGWSVDIQQPKYAGDLSKPSQPYDLLDSMEGFPQETIDFMYGFFGTQYVPNILPILSNAYKMLKPGKKIYMQLGLIKCMSPALKKALKDNNPEGTISYFQPAELWDKKSGGKHIISIYDCVVITKQAPELRIPAKYEATNGIPRLDRENKLVKNSDLFFTYSLPGETYNP